MLKCGKCLMMLKKKILYWCIVLHAHSFLLDAFQLKQLGEEMPAQFDNCTMLAEAARVKNLLKEFSETELLELPLMTDERKLVSLSNIAYTVHCPSRYS